MGRISICMIFLLCRSDDLVEIVFKSKHEYEVESKVTNLSIGIFTTAWARLELYNLLDLMGENVLYADTDSCVYVSGELKPTLENFLGGLTDEKAHGLSLHNLCMGVQKILHYKVSNGKAHCKK